MSDQQTPKVISDRLRDQVDASSDSLEPVELLADDFMRRRRAGENPTIDEYCDQHPELAGEIRDVFPALVVIEKVAPDSADLDESARTLHSPDNQPIESIGDYRVLREIGRGGMGVVYEAEQESLGRRVALKVLPRHAAKDEKSLLRFQREARAAAKMHHTNIVPVFEVGHDKDHSFYAMQLIKGQGLDHVIGDLRDLRSLHVEAKKNDSGVPDPNRRNNRGEPSLAQSLMTGHFEHRDFHESDSDSDGAKLPNDDAALMETLVQAGGSTVSAALPGQSDLSTAEDNRKAYFHSVAEIGLQSARALSYAHARGITHRDIKPSNLLLDTTGVVWITDFGLARTTDSSMTQTGDILGTIRYMSPERFKGQCDNRADVYSLGLTLYEMLVLKPAFESPDRLQLVDMVTKTEVASPRSIDSRIPRDLETIVLKAADKDPKRRYQSADDMADDLQRFVNDEPILARRATAVERVARWSRRNPWLATTMSVTAAALIAVAGISMAAAQTQSKLNGRLTEANDEQKQLNGQLAQTNDQLEAATQEQRKANEALVESNRSKEELIRDLKRSQSRLAEKQAEFVAEKGKLAESMLWLAKSYELADGQKPEFRRNLLTKLEASAARMPRVIGVERVDNQPLMAEDFRDRVQNATADERRALFQELRDTFALRTAGASVMTSDQTLMAVPVSSGLETESGMPSFKNEIRVWDVASASFTGVTIKPKHTIQQMAVHAEKRLLAAIAFQPEPAEEEPSDETTTTDSTQQTRTRAIRGSLRLKVWSIDSGKTLIDHEITSDIEFSMARRASPIHFRNDGTEILRVSQKSSTEGNMVSVHSVATGKVVHRVRIELESSGTTLPPLISADGQRLISGVSVPRSGGVRGQGGMTLLTCHDIGSGEQVGQTIQHSVPSARVAGGFSRLCLLTPNGSRVAVLTGVGRSQRIEILDFETGEQVGGAIEVPHPSGSAIELLNANPSGNQIAVAVLSQSAVNQFRGGRQTPPATSPSGTNPVPPIRPGFVQVFDVATGAPVAPPLPTSGPAQLVAMPDAKMTWGVRVADQIRTWQLPHSQMKRILIPWRGLAPNQNALPFGSRMNMAAQVALGTRQLSSTLATRTLNAPVIELAIDRQKNVIVAQQDPTGIHLRTWDRTTGRLIAHRKLPTTESEFLGMLSPGGEYLMTGHGPDTQQQMQLWRTSTATKHGKPILADRRRNAPMAISPDGVSVLFRRVEFPERQERPTESSDQGTSSPRSRTGSGQRSPRGGRGGFRARVTNTLVVVNVATGEETTVPSSRFLIATGHFSADGRYVFLNSLNQRWRYDLRSGTLDPPFETSEDVPATASGNAGGFSRGGGFLGGGRGGFSGPRVGGLSGDGMLTATIVDESVVQIRPVAADGRFGRDEGQVTELQHPSHVTALAFDPESKLLVTAASDGVIRQWSLPERWSGDADKIRHRVERHTGVALAETDEVVIVPVAEVVKTFGQGNGQQDEAKRLTSSAINYLTEDERDAIQFRNDGTWQKADAALAKWAALRPDDWQPLVLRIRPLVELKKFDDADATWDQVVQRIGRDAAFAWLKSDFDRQTADSTTQTTTSNDPRYNRIDADTAAITGWYHRRILEYSPDDATSAEFLFQMAKIHEVEYEFDEAAEAINRAVALNNDSADMHYYCAHLMGRLGRRAEEISSRTEYARLKTEDTWAYYRLVAVLANAGESDEFWKAWHAMVAARKPMIDDPESNESTVAFNRDFVAKPCLIAGPQSDEDLDVALEYADLNYGLPLAEGKDIEHWFTLCKGIAEYRRGNFEDSSRILDDAYEGLRTFKNGEDDRGLALTQFFQAMTLHELDQHAEARAAYYDGKDYHLRDQAQNQGSRTSSWTDWHLAEAARRQAFDKLGLAKTPLPKPVDTTDWTVLLEDNFDDGISEDWQQMDGDWSVIEGAACGILKRPEGATFSAYDRLAREFPELPDTFEVEYETWTSDPMLAACSLLQSSEEAAPMGHRVALTSFPDKLLVTQGKPGTGPSLVTNTAFGAWDNQSVPDFQVEPNRHYKVRIIRQPERITVFIDGKEILSERVRNIETRSIRFFARGEEGTKMFLDNVRVRIPTEVQSSE